MARLRTIEKRNNPQASELSQLIEELRRVYEKLECPETELAEAFESNRPASSEILWAIVSSPPIFDRCRVSW
jgi:hypothetical protein